MIYLVERSDDKVEIYGYPPDNERYIETENLPGRPYDRVGYHLQLYANMDTKEVWWDYLKVEEAVEPEASESAESTESLVAQIASLQNDNLATMLAITEIYEAMIGGQSNG